MGKLLLIFIFYSTMLWGKTITIYINSNVDTKNTYVKWNSTINYISQKIPNHTFKILPIAPNKYEEIRKNIKAQKIDFLITQPAIYSQLEYEFGVLRILTMNNKYNMTEFGSVFITKNKAIDSIKKIDNQRIAAVAPLGFGGWLIAYKELYDQGINPPKKGNVYFTGSQKKVLQEVLNDKANVGVIRTGMYEKFKKMGLFKENDLYIINEIKTYPLKTSTKLYPEWAFAYAPHVDKSLVNEIFKVMNSIDPHMQAAQDGGYKSWSVPEDYRKVDEIFKTFRIGHYKNMNEYNKKDIITIFSGFGVLSILFYLLLKSKLNQKLKLELEQQVQEQTSTINKQNEIMVIQSRHAAMGEMISMIAHQWRQPISAISMEVNNIKLDIDMNNINTNEIYKCIGNIQFQTEELSQTIEDFRNFFKNTKTIECTQIQSIFDSVLKIVSKNLTTQNISLNISGDLDKKIHTYKRELMQSIINIITNSREAFMEKDIQDKFIQIQISQNDKTTSISISDNAGGISDEIIDKIFEPYFSTKFNKNGSGLGLYMCKIVIDNHLQGEISVKNLTDGCCFIIEVPNHI